MPAVLRSGCTDPNCEGGHLALDAASAEVTITAEPAIPQKEHRMRSLVAALALATLAALAMGCTSPAPTATPVTPKPSASPSPRATTAATLAATPLTAEPTDIPTPLPTMAAFGDPYPAPELGDPNWAVVASWDATGARQRIASHGQAKAGAIIEAAFACEQATQITIYATDARTGDPVINMSAPCRPGQIGKGSFTPDAKKMTVNFDSASADPEARFWVKIAVPKDQYLP